MEDVFASPLELEVVGLSERVSRREGWPGPQDSSALSTCRAFPELISARLRLALCLF